MGAYGTASPPTGERGGGMEGWLFYSALFLVPVLWWWLR